jgi:hypothetical protein
MQVNQTCTKCQQDLPLAKFKPLASGKGFYKKCIACSGEKVGSASMPVEGVTTKQVKAKKTPKKILVLRGNLKKKCEELFAVYEADPIGDGSTILGNINKICAQLDALKV